MEEQAIREQILHIKWYAEHYHLSLEVASIKWITKYARAFREQFNHRQIVEQW